MVLNYQRKENVGINDQNRKHYEEVNKMALTLILENTHTHRSQTEKFFKYKPDRTFPSKSLRLLD